MTALSAEKNIDKRSNATLPERLSFPVKGSTLILQGALVALNGGYAVPASSATGREIVGVAQETVDNSAGADGAKRIVVHAGVFTFENSASTDQITQADVGKDSFAVDDQTVAKTNGGATRSRAGRIINVNSNGKVDVLVGMTGPNFGNPPAIQTGTATLASGTVTVTGVTLTSTSRIFLTRNTAAGATIGVELVAPSASRNTGTGQFVINSIDASRATVVTDTSTVDWAIIG